MRDVTPIPFFSDSIEIIPHSASSEMASYIGRPITLERFSELAGGTISLNETTDGALYAVAGTYPELVFIEGPESSNPTLKVA